MVSEINNRIENIEYKEERIFWVLFTIFVSFIVSYGFLWNNIMMNGVAKQRMEKEMASLGSVVNTLEFQYLNLKNNVTMELAQSKGFVSFTADKFATIKDTSKNLSLSINEN